MGAFDRDHWCENRQRHTLIFRQKREETEQHQKIQTAAFPAIKN